MNNPEFREQHEHDTITFLDCLEVVVKRWKMIATVTATASVISIIISLQLPKIYSSTAMILLPQQNQGMLGKLGQMMGSDLADFVSGSMLGGKGTLTDQCVSILQSDRIKGAIIDRFKLMQEYDAHYRFDMYRKMNDIVAVRAKKDEIISITAEDKDPVRAAAIANAYIDELEKVTVKFSSSDAGRIKVFLEERLAKAKVDLIKAENSLKAYQAKNKTIDINEQTKATIEGVAQLRSQLAIQEVRLASLRAYLTDDNDEIKTAKASVVALTAQIARLEGTNSGSSIPSVGSVPALGQEYLRLMREFKIQDTLVEFLTKQHEMAKLTEANDVANIQVIQKAEVPDKKIRPRCSIIVIVSTITAGLIAVFYALLRDASDRMPEGTREQWKRIKSVLYSRNSRKQVE